VQKNYQEKKWKNWQKKNTEMDKMWREKD